MAMSVYQHWDPLKVCIVGKSYPPEFYSYIGNVRVRNVMERIAIETEEDYQTLIGVLEKFGVKVLRPNINPDRDSYLRYNYKKNVMTYAPPPMAPRDYGLMLGTNFIFKATAGKFVINLTDNKTREQLLRHLHLGETVHLPRHEEYEWTEILNFIQLQGNNYLNVGTPKLNNKLNASMISRIGRDIYFGNWSPDEDLTDELIQFSNQFSEYRVSWLNSHGHVDGAFCPVKPGLIISVTPLNYDLYGYPYPGWEIVRPITTNFLKLQAFTTLKQKNYGKWWVPGEELNDEFTEFVENWLSHWVGYIEESVFDVNMLVINQNNVICNNYNKSIFEAFERHGITPHVVNFRHRFFWDGGLHCITSDLDREGHMVDYFPERGNLKPAKYDVFEYGTKQVLEPAR